MTTNFLNSAIGERGEYIMEYVRIGVCTEPGNEHEVRFDATAYAPTKIELYTAIDVWNRQGMMQSKTNPYQFWKYELVSVELVK